MGAGWQICACDGDDRRLGVCEWRMRMEFVRFLGPERNTAV